MEYNPWSYLHRWLTIYCNDKKRNFNDFLFLLAIIARRYIYIDRSKDDSFYYAIDFEV